MFPDRLTGVCVQTDDELTTQSLILSRDAIAPGHKRGSFGQVSFGQEVVGGSKPAVGLDKMHQECFDICQRCEATCNVTLHYCMTHLASGHKEHAACAALAMSCQDFCGLSAKLLGPLLRTNFRSLRGLCQGLRRLCYGVRKDEVRRTNGGLRQAMP